MNTFVFERLKKDAAYAIRSNNSDLVNQCYGAAKMAHLLGAIDNKAFYFLNDALVVKWMNIGERNRQEYAKSVSFA